jgi:hypothetical protein
MSRRSITIALVAVFVLALSTVTLAADDPFVGTWKWDSAKSKENLPSGPAFVSWIAKFEVQGNGYHVIQDGVFADGSKMHLESLQLFDGNEHPISGNPGSDVTVSAREDTNGFEMLNKKNGKEVERIHFSVSKDGRTMTLLYKRKNPQGEDVTFTRVLDKQ